jgi:outer membrane lipoprotein carrier protein
LPLSVLAVILNAVKNPRISLVLPLLLALSFASQLRAQDHALIRSVDDHYNHLRTLRARYTEHYTGMGMDRSESGTLTLKKPGLMRWSYDAPAGKLFVLDGKYAWFYTPDDAQVSRAPAKQLDDLRSPLRLLLGHTQLAKELDQLTTAPEGADFIITGVPKGMAQRVHLLTLIVDAVGAIERMKLEETDGATTEFTFSGMEEDIPLPASDFIFNPPPGVPIVNAQPPI